MGRSCVHATLSLSTSCESLEQGWIQDPDPQSTLSSLLLSALRRLSPEQDITWANWLLCGWETKWCMRAPGALTSISNWCEITLYLSINKAFWDVLLNLTWTQHHSAINYTCINLYKRPMLLNMYPECNGKTGVFLQHCLLQPGKQMSKVLWCLPFWQSSSCIQQTQLYTGHWRR